MHLVCMHLLSRWGQVFVLDALVNVEPSTSRQAESIIDRVTARLSHANPAGACPQTLNPKPLLGAAGAAAEGLSILGCLYTALCCSRAIRRQSHHEAPREVRRAAAVGHTLNPKP